MRSTSSSLGSLSSYSSTATSSSPSTGPTHVLSSQGFSYSGCYADSSFLLTGMTLITPPSPSMDLGTGYQPSGQSTTANSDNTLTVGSCIGNCIGYSLSVAIMHSGNCYCGRQNNMSAVGVAGCDSPCPGNPSQYCGGKQDGSAWNWDVYRLSPVSSTSALSSSSSAFFYTPTTSRSVSSTVSSIVSSSSAAFTETPVNYKGYVYKGCYNDATFNASLGIASDISKDFGAPYQENDYNGYMTVELCLNTCKSLNSTGNGQFAGIHNDRCVCGSSNLMNDTLSAGGDRTTCKLPCSGNTKENCGGASGVSYNWGVWQYQPSYYLANSQSYLGYYYTSCYKDNQFSYTIIPHAPAITVPHNSSVDMGQPTKEIQYVEALTLERCIYTCSMFTTNGSAIAAMHYDVCACGQSNLMQRKYIFILLCPTFTKKPCNNLHLLRLYAQ